MNIKQLVEKLNLKVLVEAEMEREIASAAEARKKEEKKSFWSRANPAGWFKKDDGDEDFAEMFSDDEGAQPAFDGGDAE